MARCSIRCRRSTRRPSLPTGRKVVVQCAGGVRSMRAAQALVAAGHEHVINLEGGINAWKAAGLPLIRIDPASGQVVERGTF